jgi:spermidine/putrescine transport system substrate-binding protein
MQNDPQASLPRSWRAGLSRRSFLRAGAGAAGAIALGPLLAACGKEGPTSPFAGDPAGIVDVANWPLYLDGGHDEAGNRIRPSLLRFTHDTGIEVNYREVIPDAEHFFQQIQPYLAAGEPTGWDVVVITNGSALTKMIQLGYLMELPADRRPNFDQHAAESVRDPAYDPNNRHTMAWQSGITGIAYNPVLTGRAITSVQDLFSPEFEGMVGMFGDAVDMPNLAMIAAGVNPEESTPDDWAATAELLATQRDSGIVKDYYVQNYIGALRHGDVALSMAWSGDVYQENPSGDPNGLQFVVPEEGAILWTDAMAIPKGAQHPVDAITFMDYVYKPEIAAMIAAYVAYVTPVPSAREEILELAEQAETPAKRDNLLSIADSPLVFPTPEDEARLFSYRDLADDEELSAWNAAFGEFIV